MYLPRVFPIRTAPFPANSQRIAFAPCDMRHLPMMSWEGPLQLAIRQNKTADAVITNRDLCGANINGTTDPNSLWHGSKRQILNLALVFDTKVGAKRLVTWKTKCRAKIVPCLA